MDDPAEEATGPNPREETLRQALTAACQEILRQDKILSSIASLLEVATSQIERRHIDFRFRVAVARIADHRPVDGDLKLVAGVVEQEAPGETKQEDNKSVT